MANFRREVWVPALRSAKLPGIGLQVLRHSAVAAMIRAGASPKALQVILGHQSAGFTLTVYGHIFEQDVAKLAERLEVVVAVTRGTATRGFPIGPIKRVPRKVEACCHSDAARRRRCTGARWTVGLHGLQDQIEEKALTIAAAVRR